MNIGGGKRKRWEGRCPGGRWWAFPPAEFWLHWAPHLGGGRAGGKEGRETERQRDRETERGRMGDYRQSTEYRKDAEALLAPAGRPAQGGGWLSELSAPQRRVFLQHLAVQVGHSPRHCPVSHPLSHPPLTSPPRAGAVGVPVGLERRLELLQAHAARRRQLREIPGESQHAERFPVPLMFLIAN
eukprot:COSAG03_NODE_711_length_6158_cov_95.789734_7_plen_185_part_00